MSKKLLLWLLIFALLASPAGAQEVRVEPLGPLRLLHAVQPAQEPSRDSQLDFYRLRIANLERQIQVYESNDAEQQRIISSQEATIKAWENRASGKVTKKEWAVMILSVVAAVGTVVGR